MFTTFPVKEEEVVLSKSQMKKLAKAQQAKKSKEEKNKTRREVYVYM